MEQIISVANHPFSKLKLPNDSKFRVCANNTFILEKYNWDFSECEDFQNQIHEIICQNRKAQFIIFTNHPHVFTLGRGNERGVNDLIDFDPALRARLKYPLYNIHRGGGITFHYPGQWICYPIKSISQNYTLDDHMCWLLKSTQKVLTDFYQVENLLTAKKLMGIWRDKRKIASIGVGLKKFVTLHGLALNLNDDKEMYCELQKINPCGLDNSIYQTVDQILGRTLTPEDFTQKFLELMEIH